MIISEGSSCHAKKWRNREITWEEFLDKLQTTHRTNETIAECYPQSSLTVNPPDMLS